MDLQDYNVDIQNYNPDLQKPGYVAQDLLFSYWLFAWFLIYYNIGIYSNPVAKFISKNMSPLLAFHVATLFVLYETQFILTNSDFTTLMKFLSVALITKGIPTYLLMRMNSKVNFFPDLGIFIILFGLYNLHLYFRGTNIIKVYSTVEKNFENNQNRTPIFLLFEYISSLLRKYLF
jgi:hypothetical protein